MLHRLAARLGLLAALGLGLLLAAGSARAEPAKLVIGVETQDYMPIFGIRDGQYAGFSRELLDRFAAESGYVFEYRPLPVPRLYASLAAGQIDFKFPDDPNWKAEDRTGKPYVYSVPLTRYIDGTMVRKDRVGGAPDLVHRLGTITGFAPFVWLDRIKSGKPEVVENVEIAALVSQIMGGRIDGAYLNVAAATRAAVDMGLAQDAILFDPGLPYIESGYKMSTLAHPDVIARFDAWMAANASEIAAMRDRHKVERGLDRR